MSNPTGGGISQSETANQEAASSDTQQQPSTNPSLSATSDLPSEPSSALLPPSSVSDSIKSDDTPIKSEQEGSNIVTGAPSSAPAVPAWTPPLTGGVDSPSLFDLVAAIAGLDGEPTPSPAGSAPGNARADIPMRESKKIDSANSESSSILPAERGAAAAGISDLPTPDPAAELIVKRDPSAGSLYSNGRDEEDLRTPLETSSSSSEHKPEPLNDNMDVDTQDTTDVMNALLVGLRPDSNAVPPPPISLTQIPLRPNSAFAVQEGFPVPTNPDQEVKSPFDRYQLDRNTAKLPIRPSIDELLEDPIVTVPLVSVRGIQTLLSPDDEICLLCGSTGCPDWQIFCHDCGECFHTFCLNPPITRERIKPSLNEWRCPHCKFCETCRGASREDELIVCDSCDRCYHMFCLSPPLPEIPQGGWRCNDCLKCIRCGAFGSSVSEWTHSNTLCAECGVLYDASVQALELHLSGPTSPLKFPTLKLKFDAPTKPKPTKSKSASYAVKAEEGVQTVQDKGIAGIPVVKMEPRLSDHDTTAIPSAVPIPASTSSHDHLEADEQQLLDAFRLFIRLSPYSPAMSELLEKVRGLPIWTNLSPAILEELNAEMNAPDSSLPSGSKPPAPSNSGLAASTVALAGENNGNSNQATKLKGRLRKDGLPIVTKQTLARMARHCGIDTQVLVIHVQQATQLRTLSLTAPLKPPKPKAPDFKTEQANAKLRSQPKKPLNYILDLAEAEGSEGIPEDYLAGYEGEKKQLPNGKHVFILQSGISIPLKEKKTRKKRKHGVDPPEALYGKAAFTSDFGYGTGVYAKRRKRAAAEAAQSEEFSEAPLRRSTREAASFLASILESEAQAALFDSHEHKRSNTKPKKEPQQQQPRPNPEEIGTISSVYELFDICQALESGVPLLTIMSSDFDRSSIKCAFDVELLRRKELVDPRVRQITKLVTACDSEAPAPILCKDSLNVWDRPEPSGSGLDRMCQLCRKSGDQMLRGRLIQADVDVWVHVNCAAFSAEVVELESGDLLHVQRSLERAKLTKCKACNTVGATLLCKSARCPNAFHFACAIQANCQFSIEERSILCEHHAISRIMTSQKQKKVIPSPPPKFETPLWCFMPARRAFVDMSDVRQKKPKQNHLLGIDILSRRLADLEMRPLPRIVQHRVGALTVHNLGRIVWEYPAFRTSLRVIPGDYFASRKFWSWLPSPQSSSQTTFKRSLFDLEIAVSVEHKRPVYRIVCRDDPDPAHWVQAWSAMEAWSKVVQRVNESRMSQSISSSAISAALDADIYFGHGCPTVMKQIELLPNVKLVGRAPVEPYVFQHSLTICLPVPLVRAVMFKDDPDASIDLPENPSGCARSEPFKKVSYKEKFSRGDQFGWHPASLICRPIISRLAPAPSSATTSVLSISIAQPNGLIREQDPLVISQKYQRMKEREATVMRVMRSKIHEWGVFAMEDIKSGEYLIEYVGELIRASVADLREKFYDSKGVGCYMFRLDEEHIIDATKRGNMARFINHCCEPNAATEVVLVHGKKHIVIYAKRDIRKGEELSYDYMFNFEDETHKIPCCCGARNCRGWMN